MVVSCGYVAVAVVMGGLCVVPLVPWLLGKWVIPGS